MAKHRNLARNLRTRMTEAETFVWRQLRGRRFHTFKFRRQFAIENSIVDFVCLERRLIIELDGGPHSLRRTEDQQRTAVLEQQGFRAIRFWNFEVMGDWETVSEAIWNALNLPSSPGD